MKRLLLVEDEPGLVMTLTDRLGREGYAVETSGDGESALERAASGSFDLVLLDVMLPRLNGFDLLRELRRRGTDTPVIVLTARGQVIDKVVGLKLGADDYVTKPFGVLELLARVEALLRRSPKHRAEAGAPVHERFGDVDVDISARAVHREGQPVALTPMEFDLLLALLRRRGAVASRLELMKEVWGYHASVVSRTVDTHVAELRRKLEDDPAMPRHILTVRKAGYRLQT